MASEFDLIARYFTHTTRRARLGVGDDAALIAAEPGMDLAISADMLVAGTHFFPDVDPYRLGHKALAVNLSDLAAMGAIPRSALLSLALPEIEEAWLAAFSQGFMDLAGQFEVELIGGDTTRGPLNLAVTVLGAIESGQALRRDTAQLGDDIWVSGELGAAALAVAARRGEFELDPVDFPPCLDRLEMPVPRVALGRSLRGIAHAAIDISDGLLADLGHILERSHLGAEIRFPDLPAAPAVAKRLTESRARQALLAGGDDYELCFTAAPGQADAVRTVAKQVGVAVTRIGVMCSGQGLTLLDAEGQPMVIEERGFDHFPT